MNLLFKSYLLIFLIVPALLACQPSSSKLPLGAEASDVEEATITAEMIAAIKSYGDAQAADGTMPRFNQPKTHACVTGEFRVNDQLPTNLQQGILQPGARYPVLARFANAKKMDDREKDFRGLAMQLRNTPGESLWGEAGRVDVVLNSYPQLFAGTPAHFLKFVEATRDGKLWRYFINPAHFYSLPIALRGQKKTDSLLNINYYSTTPYRLGADTDQAVKYSVSPCAPVTPSERNKDDKNFLKSDLQEQLQNSKACFHFNVQLQTDAETMPIENAAKLWPEELSPYQTVATIVFPPQALTSAEEVNNCENARFNPWQTTADHKPLGGINRVRMAIYAEMGEYRTHYNRTH